VAQGGAGAEDGGGHHRDAGANTSYPKASFLVVLRSLIRIQSVRHEIGKPWRWAWIAIGAIVFILIF
jgi:hypothetical protein